MLGDEPEWVKNIRAAGGVAFIKRGRTQPVRLAEIPPEQRAPILKAWSQVATSGRKHLTVSHEAPVAAFEAIAADHPVFRIDQREWFYALLRPLFSGTRPVVRPLYDCEM